MIVSLYRKRKRAFMFSLENPIPPDPLPAPYIRENIVAKALEFYNFLKEDSSRSYLHVSRHFSVSRARVSQLIGLVDHLPKDFIDEMKDRKDQKILKIYSGKKLLKIAALPEIKINREIKKGPLFRK